MDLVLALLLVLAFPVQQAPAANYDEAKVPRYTLPPLLVTNAGDPVRGPGEWPRRREEICSLLEDRMFGRAPGRPDKITFEVVSIDKAALGGRAVRKQIAIGIRGQTLRLLVYLPARAGRPTPVFVALGFAPNQTVASDTGITLAGSWERDPKTGEVQLRPPAESSRGVLASRWQVERIIERGYGLATMYYGDIEPDFEGALRLGIRAKYLVPGQQQPGDGEWGAIAAWAWGLSRAVDYLETDKDVDASAVAVVGHSRLGKTALWAAATDARLAMVVSNDSGEGGAAISRRRFGETVADLRQRQRHAEDLAAAPLDRDRAPRRWYLAFGPSQRPRVRADLRRTPAGAPRQAHRARTATAGSRAPRPPAEPRTCRVAPW
jgi:hypothetical protein